MRALILIALAVGGDRVIQSDAEVGDLAFSPDGGALAGVCRDGKVRLWDSRSGALQKTVAWDPGDAGVTLAERADTLASVGKQGGIKLWDLQSGGSPRRIPTAAQQARSLALSRDRKLLAGAGRASLPGSENVVYVWDASGKERFHVNSGIGGISRMAFSPDGATLVAAGYDADVRAWSTRNGELLRLIDELQVSMFAVAFSPDGRHLATAGVDRIVYLWDAKTWKLARKLVGQPEMISSMDFSPDGKMLATGGFDSTTTRNPVKILVWDVASGKVIRTLPAAHAVRSAVFSPDGKLLAAAGLERSVNIWNLAP